MEENSERRASFEEFLSRVEVQREHLLEELLSAEEECNCGRMEEKDRQELILRALTQHDVYYQEKSRAAKQHVFSMFSPPWYSSLECAFFWLSGFRPSALFRLVSSSVPHLSPHQLHRLHQLKEEIRREEKVLSDEQAKVQESISSLKVMKAMKHTVGRETEEAMQEMRVGMEGLVASADSLRTRTASNVVEILDSAQSIRFLVAATQLERNMSLKGRERDALLASGSYI